MDAAEGWKDAAEQYTEVVEMNPKGKYVKDAAYAAVLAWKNALNVDDQGQGPVDKRPRRVREATRTRSSRSPSPSTRRR